MRKELCRFCGTRDHHQSEMHLCKAMKSDAGGQGPTQGSYPSAQVGSIPAPASRRLRKKADDILSPMGDEDCNEAADVPLAPSDTEPDRVAEARSSDEDTGPLTPAEKQRRYREKHGKAYLAREVERMRRKREK